MMIQYCMENNKQTKTGTNKEKKTQKQKHIHTNKKINTCVSELWFAIIKTVQQSWLMSCKSMRSDSWKCASVSIIVIYGVVLSSFLFHLFI